MWHVPPNFLLLSNLQPLHFIVVVFQVQVRVRMGTESKRTRLQQELGILVQLLAARIRRHHGEAPHQALSQLVLNRGFLRSGPTSSSPP
uniref:Secreted protein n=1 Tax=Oryza punctata TaxID=4537 RepID=A0A0E0LYA0_ORYPU